MKARTAVDLYIDLLIRIIANTIYRDDSMAPWQEDRAYRDDVRAAGMDWPSKAHSMVGVARLENLATLTRHVLEEKVPGAFIETGVWRGGCCILMRGILAAYEVTDRIIYAADSFRGLPAPNPSLYPEDIDDPHHTFPQLAVSLEEVKKNFELYGLLDDGIRFVEGFFNESLHKIPEERFALIRLYGDMYESTIVALRVLYPRLSPEGYVIIDDYGAVKGCSSAVEDFRKEFRITAPVNWIDGGGIFWRKPLNELNERV